MFKIRFTQEAAKQLLHLKNTKSKQRQYKAAGKIIGYMQVNLRHPSLNTHKFDQLKSPFSGGVFESYTQNKTATAYRIFWVYGPEKNEITILAITQHP
jgi:mRNA-degrading endonuclease RelE of RelBE toxin-antitoxin system